MRAPLRSFVRGAAMVVALAALGAGVASSSGGGGPPAEDWIARSDDDAVFTVDCRFSHRAPDDPIVFPGASGASHSHEFFGSTATDASSSGASLRGTATTCEDHADTAAYWVPTLSVDGTAVEPTLLRAYYRARPGVDVRDVTAPPLGLAMISGHHGAPGEVGWGCGLRPRRLRSAPPGDCTAISPLTLQLRFPDCWDGRNLDSPDHHSHVVRSVDGACPPTHPVLMTELQVSVSWPVTGPDGARVALDSGAVQGAHGDFLNGWDPGALAGRVELCVWAKANCTIG